MPYVLPNVACLRDAFLLHRPKAEAGGGQKRRPHKSHEKRQTNRKWGLPRFKEEEGIDADQTSYVEAEGGESLSTATVLKVAGIQHNGINMKIEAPNLK